MCNAKHTVVQIPDSDWGCPSCGAGIPLDVHEMGFIIDFPAEDSEGDCQLLHEEDECKCYKCGKSFSGQQVAVHYMKKTNVITCPKCKGIGVIPKEDQ